MVEFDRLRVEVSMIIIDYECFGKKTYDKIREIFTYLLKLDVLGLSIHGNNRGIMCTIVTLGLYSGQSPVSLHFPSLSDLGSITRCVVCEVHRSGPRPRTQ